MIIVKKWKYVILLLLVSAILGKLFWPHPSIANLRNQPGPIVVLGDSISAGTGSESHQGYVALLQNRLGIELINAGIPGDTTARGLMRLPRDVLERKPALVLVELGGNDFLQKVDLQETQRRRLPKGGRPHRA